MTKYIFKKLKDETNEYDISELTMEIEAFTLTEIIEEFGNFLKGSGFSSDGVDTALGKLEDTTCSVRREK